MVRAAEDAAAVAADAASPIRYTQSDRLNIAYQITGAGDVDLVLVAGFVSHLMLDWTERRHAHFLHRLGDVSRLIRFDKRGTGISPLGQASPSSDGRNSRRPPLVANWSSTPPVDSAFRAVNRSVRATR